MFSLAQQIKGRIREIREDYGRIGFWAVYALVMPIFGLAALTAVIYELGPWLKENPLGIVFFTIGVTILCGFAILTTNIISIVAGWAFGFGFGLLSMMTAIAGAISINFVFSRKLAGAKFDQILKDRPRIDAIHKELLAGHLAKVFAIILLLRLSVTPFAGTNYLIAASGVSFGTYFWATIIGYIPRTAAAVFVGTTLVKLDFNQPGEAWLLVLTIAATIVVMILISILSKRALDRLTAEADQLV